MIKLLSYSDFPADVAETAGRNSWPLLWCFAAVVGASDTEPPLKWLRCAVDDSDGPVISIQVNGYCCAKLIRYAGLLEMS